MTKWRPKRDIQLHRLVCYLKGALSYRQYAWVGDSQEDLELHLYTDAGLANLPTMDHANITTPKGPLHGTPRHETHVLLKEPNGRGQRATV